MAKQTKTQKTPFAPSAGFTQIGQNVYARVDSNGKLTIEIDMGADLGPTSTGKSLKVATTGGNVSIGGGLKIGLNVYEPVLGR